MKYEEFRRQLGKAGLTVKGFAQLIHQTPNSITNYSSHGSVPAHLAIIAVLMGELAENGLDFRTAMRRIEIDSSKSRGSSRKGRFGGKKQQDIFRSLKTKII